MGILTPVLLTALVGVVSWMLWKRLRKGRMSGPHPFRPIPPDVPSTAERYVYDWKARKKLLRVNFSAAAAQEGGPYDAIVIGSGIGGLSVASVLAKMGRKVLVLEQNTQLGGCCHTFSHKGYEFDVGIHYIGKMSPGFLDRFIMDQLTEGRLEWTEMDPQFDNVVLGGSLDDPSQKPVYVPIGRSLTDSEAAIVKQFPDEKEAIQEFFNNCRKNSRMFMEFYLIKIMPLWLVRLLDGVGLLRRIFSFFNASRQSLGDYLEKLTPNSALRTTLAYAFGDYGTVPKSTSVCLHSALWSHFRNGGFYPVGGASEITLTLMQVVQAAGGRIFGKARVSEIICDSAGRAVGVRVKPKPEKGQPGEAKPPAAAPVDLMAPIIVSSAGVLNTAKMLPKAVLQTSNIPDAVQSIGAGIAAVNVFVGLRNSPEELGLTKCRNYWCFPYAETLDIDAAVGKMLAFGSLEEFLASDLALPVIFASFPSTKDPLWERRTKNKPATTCTVIAPVAFEWFSAWSDTKVKKRGEEYEGVKKALGMRIWHQFCSVMPEGFEEKADIELMDIGTPLTNNHYLGATRGEIYGLDHTVARFGPKFSATLRPNIGVEGLYLSGQDVMTCGFVSALYGGMTCASEITGRNLVMDATRIRKAGFKGAPKATVEPSCGAKEPNGDAKMEPNGDAKMEPNGEGKMETNGATH